MASSLRSQLLRMQTFCRYTTRRKLSQTSAILNALQPQVKEKTISIPQPDGEEKVYSPKLEQIFKSISQLTLLEVAELSDLLKKRLNLPDAPVMSFNAAAAPAATAAQVEEDEEKATIVQTNYTVKLIEYDEKQKITIIKEIKNVIPDMNLVQAKKLIESAPTILMKDISKDEAEKIKETLVKVGAKIVIE